MNTQKRILHITLLMVLMLYMGIRVQANDVIHRHWPLQFIQPIHVESPLYYWSDSDFHDENVELNEPVSIDSFDPITKTCQRTATYTYDGKNYEDVIDFHLVEETTNKTYTISIHNLQEGKYRLWIDYHDIITDDDDFYNTGIDFEPTWSTTDNVHYIGTFPDGTTEKKLRIAYRDGGENHYGAFVTINVKPYEIRNRTTDTIFFNSHDFKEEGGIRSFCYKPYNSRPEIEAETRPFLNVSSCIIIKTDWIFSDQYAYCISNFPTPIYHLRCMGSSESTLPDCDKDVQDYINLIYCPTVEHGDTIICTEDNSINFHGRILELGTHHDVEYYHIDQDINAKSKHHFYDSIKVTHPMDVDGIYAQPTEGGSVVIQDHTEGQKYCYGETITLVVTPDECYEMTGWEDGYDTQSTTREVKLDEDMLGAYRPVLSRKTVTVKIQSNDATLGSAGPTSTTVNCGESVNITANPAEHCHLTGWSDEPENQSLTRSISPTSDTTITANFETIIITIHDEDFPENVDVTGKEDDETYEHGKELTFTAATVVCKNFNGWKDGTSKETTSRTFIVGVDDLTADKFVPKYEDKVYSGEETITIYDSQKPYHWHGNDYNTSGDYSIVLTTAQGCDSTAVLHLTITADPTHEVNVTPEDDTKGDVTITDENDQPITSGDHVEAGSTITLEAKPKKCQEFEKWSDGNTDKTRSITVNSDTTLQAIFKDFQPTVAIIINGLGVVKVNGENVQTLAIACGSNVSLVANHLSGYAFENWSDGVTEANRTLTNITKDTTLTANFRQLTKYYVTIEPQDPNQGSVNVEVYQKNSDGKYEVYEGFQIRFQAQAKPGYKFKEWSNGVVNSYTSATINSDSTIYAIFEPKTRTVHIDINGSEYGSISVTGEGVTDKGNGDYEVQDGKTIQLTATPTDSECDEFSRWFDTNTSENPRTITVNENKTISAGFTHKTYSIQINPNHGTVKAYNKDNQLITNNTVNCGEDVTLVAAPATGYRFDHWEDNPEAGATRVINNVHANITNKVVFVALTINIKTDDGEDITVDITDDKDGDGQIGIGDKITITAPTKDCKEFEKWSDENTENQRVIDVIGDINLTAQYKTVKYTITTKVKLDEKNQKHGSITITTE